MQGEMWKLIVFGTMFFFWILSQIKSKDAAALGERPPGPDPRPGGLPPAPRPGGRDAFGRAGGAPSARPTGPRRHEQDEIIVIRSEPTRGPARPGTVAARRPARARTSPPPTPPRRPEASGPGPLPMPTGVSQKLDTTLDVKPFMLAPTDLSSPSAASARPVAVTNSALAPSPAVLAIREALGSPQRTREAILLSELLQPPLSMRAPRGLR